MVYQETDRNELSRVELAQGGHLPSLSWWLNQRLAPHRLHAKLSFVKPGYIRLVLAILPAFKEDPRTPAFKKRIIRYLCHQLWILNSDVLDGAYVVAAYAGKPGILWKQSVRIVSPARRSFLELNALESTSKSASKSSVQALSKPSEQQTQRKIRQASQQKQQFQAMRSLLVSGSSAAAFIIGCWLGYADAPPEQTAASARGAGSGAIVQQSNGQTNGQTQVKAALEMIPIIQHKATSSDQAVNLLFGGDVALTNSYTDKVGRDFQWSFSQFPELREADISMVNLEAPFTQQNQILPGKKFNFKAPIENVQVLQNGGIDIVNLANNHAMDYQGAGLSDTLATLEKAGIQSVGAGTDLTKARRPIVMEVKGQKVAYLGYYDADLHAATATTPGTNPRHNDRVAADIKALRGQVDWIVVNYHWGEELAKYPGDWQIDLARFTIDQGADLVVGHHPHVLQGAEVYKGRPIVYSLGNFIFGGKAVSDYDTAALKVSLKEQQMKVEFLPVQVRNFQAKVVNGQSGQQILSQITNVSDIFQMPMTSAMTLDLKTNQAHAIEAGKDAPAIASPTETQTPIKGEPVKGEVSKPNLAKPDAAKPTPIQSPSPEPTKTPDPNNPWSQDSFITEPGKSEKLLKPVNEQGKLPATVKSPLKPDSTLDGTESIETASVQAGADKTALVQTASFQEPTIDDLEKESMAPGESTEVPKGISPNSELSKDTVISAPEQPTSVPPDSVTPDRQMPIAVMPPTASLEPMTKRYAESTVPDLGSVAVLPKTHDSSKGPDTVEKAVEKAAAQTSGNSPQRSVEKTADDRALDTSIAPVEPAGTGTR